MSVKNKTKASVLASFATLKSLSEEQKYHSPYQILCEFVKYIIVSNSLHCFTVPEMQRYLMKEFGFSIPEAVVRSSLKHLQQTSLSNGLYSVSIGEINTDLLFESKKREAEEKSSNIIKLLKEYVESRTGERNIKEDVLTQELMGFLVEEQGLSSNNYTELIGEFILKNENNIEIQNVLDGIREGSILYIGLSYNINETGNINKKIYLYLGTEILFSLMGYNGTLFSQLAQEFYEQTYIANSKGEKKIILRYFTETKKEIEEFFATAGEIIAGKRRQWVDKPAMKAILNGCSTESDIIVKKSDFYHDLQYIYGITEDTNDSYYDEESFYSNLEDFEFSDDEDRRDKKETGLRLISHINKLRNGNSFYNDMDSEHLIVTNTKVILMMSKEQSDRIKLEKNMDTICNFAVSLDRITNLIWYKLGNSFTHKQYPVSVNALLKARIVLSSSIAKKADIAFGELKRQYEDGEITEEKLAARIIALRNKPKLPEDLISDEIDDIMNFSPDVLSRFEEQVKLTEDSLKEKEEIIMQLSAESSKVISEKEAEIVKQEEVIKNKESENEELRKELNIYKEKEQKKTNNKKKIKNFFLLIWSIAWKLIILIMIFYFVSLYEEKNGSKILGTFLNVVGLIGFLKAVYDDFKKNKEKYFPKK
jgi:hypothetical protein